MDWSRFLEVIMFLNIIFLVVGFMILIKGADLFVDGASGVAGNLKVSKRCLLYTLAQE
jgi:Ca2+/Na+ antiporter